MAKNNNLTDFLTGVADAIRTKKGTSALIDPQDFESEIGDLPTDLLKKVVNNDTVSITAQDLAGATQIRDYAFYGNTGLKEIEVPDSVLEIGNHSFEGCTNIEKMDLPFLGQNATTNNYLGYIFGLTISGLNTASLKYLTIRGGNIGTSAFRGCSGLISVDYPSIGLTSMPTSMFYGCSGLKSITIPDSVTSIGNSAFNGCSSLTSITIPNSVTNIGDWAFAYCSGLTSITIPNSVTSIGTSAFASCSSLTSVTIGSGVTSIGKNAFNNCSSLTSVYYEGTIEDWCNISFGNSYSNPMFYASHFYMKVNNVWQEVTEIVIPNTISAIKIYTFFGFGNLTSITIPDSVTSIGSYAFNGCSSLTSITIPDSVTSIGRGAFNGCSSLQYTDGDLIYIKTTDNNYFALFDTTNTSIATATINSNCRFILADAFSNHSSLTSITIPNSVTSIGSSAFSGCTSLANISIPNSVTSIGNSAFNGCTGLMTANLYLLSSENKITKKPTSLSKTPWFYGCSTSLTIHASSTLDATTSKTAFGNYWNYITTSATATTVYDL